MGIWSEEIFAVVCDQADCFASSDESVGDHATSEDMAKERARRDGYVERDGQWFCPEHAEE